MALIKLKPVTPGQRFKVNVKTEGLHKGKPEKKLTSKKNRRNGRNNTGKIMIEGQGGGHKRRLRDVDFKRNKDGIVAKVSRIEYDPNRSANIALLVYQDGEKRYMLAPRNLKVGDTVVSGHDAPISSGNCLPMHNIPVGSLIHHVEMKPGKGAQMVRSAGAYARLMAREGDHATIRLPSGEMRKVLAVCKAVLGEVGNGEHSLRVLGKAGASRHRGIRPNVRGVAKNPVDHPLGGGEGRTSGGRPPCNAKGKPEGRKTRNRKRPSTKLIVRRRDRG